jgi:dephospho-CoA kinase
VLLVGLTGGIGAGKSTVAELLAARGAVVVDADSIARLVVEPGGPAYQRLIDRFGADIVAADGTLDRAAIASRAFADPATLRDLNAITHPAIRDRMLQCVAAHAGSDRVVVLDIPLLTATTRDQFGLAGVIVVDTPVEVAVGRLVHQRGLSEADARARMAAQISREERRRLADVVVDNSGTPAALEASVEQAWAWIAARQSSATGPGADTGPAGDTGPAAPGPGADTGPPATAGQGATAAAAGEVTPRR